MHMPSRSGRGSPGCDDGWLGHRPRVAVKLPTDLVAELRHTYPNEVREARPLDQRYWVAIPLGAHVPDSELSELLAVSYRDVVARLPRSRRPSARDPR